MVDSAPREVNGLQLPPLNHIGVVVHNRDATIRRYQDALGIGKFETYDRHFEEAWLRGEPCPTSLRIGFGQMGPVLFEVIEPLEGPSLHREFLEQHGEGIQHLAFVVPDLDGNLDHLAKNDMQLLFRANVPGRSGSIAYVEGGPASNVLLELIQDSPGTQEFFNRLWEATRG